MSASDYIHATFRSAKPSHSVRVSDAKTLTY